MNKSQEELLHLHRHLDMAVRNPNGKEFISGWQTDHPFVGEYLPVELFCTASGDVLNHYTFLSDSADIISLIRDFHIINDGVTYERDGIFVSSGSSALMQAFLLFLKSTNVQRLYYVPPIYYIIYYFCRLLGIELIPVARAALHSEDARLELPAARINLLISDPIWIMGTNIHERHASFIAEWQRRTGSTVFVDGTFQYTQWDHNARVEPTARLEQDLTYRLVCPTKSLAIPGVRFAYMLIPPGRREDIRYPCSNITGSTGAFNNYAAIHIMKVLNSKSRNSSLINFIIQQYEKLKRSGVILEDAADLTATYYTLARVNNDLLQRTIVMDQRFFELQQFNGLVRVNLLYPGWRHRDLDPPRR